MRKLRPFLVTLAAWALTFAAAQDLLLLHLADLHSAYDRYPRLVSLVEATVEEHPDAETAILVNGDVFELGNPVARASQGEADWSFLERLDALAPVILNLANHEFDFQEPRAVVDEARGRGLEVIGSLVDAEEGAALAPPVATLRVGGRIVDVVGIATDQESTYAEEARPLLLAPDPVDYARYLGPLTVMADHVVVLSHAGVGPDREILASAPERVLYAVGAHDHLAFVDESLGLPYAHAGFKGERLLVAEVSFRPGGGASVSFSERSTDEHDQADAELRDEIARLREQHLSAEDLATVGTVPRDLTVREAALWSVEALAEATDADVALLNHTSFGAGLAEGELPRHRFDAFMRFDNDVMVTEMEGETLARVLDQANQGPDTPLAERTGDFLYASDLDPQPGETYRVVTSSWVALPFNQGRYLGVEDVEFRQIEGVTTKGLLADALD